MDAAALAGTVAARHLEPEAVAALRTRFGQRAARYVHIEGFLRPEVADQLSRFLLEHAHFYTEFGLADVEGPVTEEAWTAAAPGERFFRMGKLLRTREGSELSPEALRYLRFRRELQGPAMRAYFEAVTGLPLQETDDFGVHAMGDGDFLEAHSDAKGDRQLALVLYLTPGWDERDGGVLQIVDSAGDVSAVLPTFNSLVAFDVRAGTRHLVTPVVAPGDHPPRVTIGGWYDRGS